MASLVKRVRSLLILGVLVVGMHLGRKDERGALLWALVFFVLGPTLEWLLSKGREGQGKPGDIHDK